MVNNKAELYKNERVRASNRILDIKKMYNSSELSHEEYINELTKDYNGKTLSEWIRFYDKVINESKPKSRVNLFLTLTIIGFAVIFLLIYGVSYTGFFSKLTIANITIDGNFDDWVNVLSDNDNYIVDSFGADDSDNISKSGYDLVKVGFTWDSVYLYFFIERMNVNPAGLNILFYFDKNENNLMEYDDKVVKLEWKSLGHYDSFIFDYVPFNASGDNIYGDGYDMPGSITNKTALEISMSGIDEFNRKLETRLIWSALNIATEKSFKVKISSARGSGENLPLFLEDNTRVIDVRNYGVSIRPSLYAGGVQGTNITLTHYIKNLGSVKDSFNIDVLKSKTWPIFLYWLNESLLPDYNGDLIPDTGLINPDSEVGINVVITIPSDEVIGSINEININAISNFGNIYESVIDKVIVGAVSILPGYNINSSNNTVVNFNHVVRNNLNFSDTIDLSFISQNAWNATGYYDNGSLLVDTNNDSFIDVGILNSGESRNITIQLFVLDVSVGTVENFKIFANFSSNFSNSGYVTNNILISKRVLIEPNYNTVSGVNVDVFYLHNVYNNYNTSDLIDLSAISSLNWSYEFLDVFLSKLTDTDFDGKVDTGLMQPNSVKQIYLKLSVPSDALENTNDTTKIFANSSINSLVNDFLIDLTTVKKLVTFKDAGFSIKSDTFRLNSTIYAKVYGLSVDYVTFEWYDSNDTLVRVSSIKPVSGGTSTDQFTTNMSSLPGNWTVIVKEITGQKLELARTIFKVILFNRVPFNVSLFKLNDGNVSFERRPTFSWYNTIDLDNDSLSYNLEISNNTNFLPLVYNYSNIGEAVNFSLTNFTVTEDLPTDVVLYWRVRAFDGFDYGNYSVYRNFTINSLIIGSLLVNFIDFGIMDVLESRNTSLDNPPALLLRNDGNVDVDVQVKSSDLWASVFNPSQYYQYKIRENKTNSFNKNESTVNFAFMPTMYAVVDISRLRYKDVSDDAKIDLLLTVPSDEPSGVKNSTITVSLEVAQ